MRSGKFKQVILILIMVCTLVSASAGTDWTGRYTWINPTDKTNNGAMVSYTLEVVAKEDSPHLPYEIFFTADDKRYRMFPLLDPGDDTGQWIDYESDAVYAEAYRKNAAIFNTTKFTPSKWYLKSQRYEDGFFESVIVSKAMALQFSFTSTMKFTHDANGNQALLFNMEGTGVASWGLFKNPKPGYLEDKNSYLLIKQ